jgi:hypothetical protein
MREQFDALYSAMTEGKPLPPEMLAGGARRDDGSRPTRKSTGRKRKTNRARNRAAKASRKANR